MGSKKKTKTIINGCTLDWDNKQKCSGFVKITYKRIQSINAGKNLNLVGVPTDTCANSLQQVLRTKMEEAREKMVKKSPYKYGTINKVPHFVLEHNFVKNTPYAECSKEDNIPFWLRTPYHLEYVLVMEEQLELILHYMCCSKRFQILVREAAFYYKNPRMKASGSEQGMLAGVLMRHFAMVQSMNKVLLKGIAHVDRQFPLARYEDKSEEAEVDLEVDQLVRELIMEKQAASTRVWILIAQVQDGQRAGFYCSGIGNNSYKKIAIEWSKGLSSHIWFYLLHQGFEAADINKLIRGPFDFKAAKEAAKAVVGRDRRNMSQSQAAMERMLEDQGKNMTWADITLGMTKKQLQEHDKELSTTARQEKELEHDYNFEKGH